MNPIYLTDMLIRRCANFLLEEERAQATITESANGRLFSLPEGTA